MCYCVQGSLDRLNQKSVDLYQIHWPGFPVLNSWANDAFCKGLIKCHQQGLAKAVGVSNYNVNRLQRANGIFKVRIWSFSSSSPLPAVPVLLFFILLTSQRHNEGEDPVLLFFFPALACVLFFSSSCQQTAARQRHDEGEDFVLLFFFPVVPCSLLLYDVTTAAA